MKLNSLKFLLIGVLMIILCLPKKAYSQLVVTGLTGVPGTVSTSTITPGSTSQVPFGFSINVPKNKTFSPGTLNIVTSSSLVGVTSGTLNKTTSATASLATSSGTTYAVTVNSGTLSISGLGTLTGANVTGGTTYYYYFVLDFPAAPTGTVPSSVVFSLPTTAATLSTTTYTGGGGTTITNLSTANTTTYDFAPAFSYPTPVICTVGTPISTLLPTSTYATITGYGASSGPAGLTLNPTTGAITGIPTTATPATNYTLTAVTSTGVSSTFVINVTVNNILPAFSYATPQTYTQFTTISTLSPTNTGGSGSTYSAVTALPTGLSLNTATGDITGTPTVVSTATNYTIKATNSIGSSTTVVNIAVNLAPPAFSYASPQTYTQGVAITTLSPSNTGGAVASYSATSLPAGLSINTTTGAITGMPTVISTATSYTITATNTAGSSTATVNITVNPVAPAISYATPQTYTQGVAISTLSPTSTGGTVATYSASSLPAGLSIDATTGNITGTPTTVSAATNYTITATNAAGSSTAIINIKVNAGPPNISYPTPDTYVQGTAITTLSPTNIGGTVLAYTASGLPAGLSINAATGAITGTPTTVTPATNYTITATSLLYGSSTFTVNITINPKLPAISYTTPQTYTQNVAITTLSPTSTGGAVASYSATLPAGLSINTTTGAITGTPTAGSAAANYTVTATNVTGSSTATINITIIIAAPTASNITQCGAGAPLTASDISSAGGNYNWYNAATGGTAFQSGTSATYSAVATGTYYVSYTYGGVESARTTVTSTINPIVSAPYSGAYFSYPFNGNTNDVSSYGNNGSNTNATLTTDRYGASNAAYNFNGTSAYITDPFLDNNPSIYTISIWFNTTSTTGGTLIGLESGSLSDRVLYMANSGQLYWGLYPTTVQTINTASSYNDGDWHHAIVTVSSSGSALYVDGILQASSTAMTTANGVNGYWQMGYINLGGWASAPTSNYFTGKLDDIAVYHRQLSSAEIASSNDVNQIYVGTGTACSALTFNAPTITGATYTWKDPNNSTQTGQSVSFPGAVAGNYTLTVTGGPGGCSSTVTLTPVIYASTIAAFNVPASIPVSTNTSISLYSGVGSSTYTWNFGSGASPATGTGQGPFTVQWSSTGVKTITLTVTTSGSCSITTTQNITVTSTAFGNYTYSRPITLQNATVGMSASVSNFPMLLSIQSNDLIVTGTCADKIQNPTSNYDFAFFDPSASSELYYQVQSYNTTTGTLLVWVRIPTVSATTNNTLTFYYGSKVPPVTHNAAFFENTWTADYQAVYHFSETAYQTTTADGTAYGRTASLAGFSAGNYVASGKIGSCYTFGGVEDMEAPAVAPSSTVTLSAWINTSNNNVDEKVLTDQNSNGTASDGYKLGVYYGSAETEDDGYINRSSTSPAEPTPLTQGTWYYVQGVYDGTNMYTYVNGVQYKKYTVTATSTFTNTLYIGIGEGKIYPFNGMIDEPRVSNVAKSSDWIKMEYANQNAPVYFTTVGASTCNTTNGSATPGEVSYTWTGTTSTDPSVSTNWINTSTTANAVPAFDGSATLIIPTGLSKYPALTAPISVYGLSIASGAQLNLNGNIISVGCHIYNNSGGQILYGTTSTAGGITFNGSLATQYYYGTTTGIASVGNLTVNNSAGGTVDITGGAFGVSNILTLTSGNLFIDNTNSGSLTLLSTATNSASVAAIPSAYNITGNVNVQRFITSGAGTRGYRLLTSPVNVNSSIAGTGSLGLTYLNTNATFNSTTYYGAYTQGPGTGFTLNGSVHPIIYLYDQSQPTYNGSFTGGKNIGVYTITGSTGSPAYGVITQGTSIASTAVNIPIANSYLLYFVGSDQSSVVTSTRVPDATTLTATGYLNQGNVPFKFWSTGSASLPYNVTTGTTNYGLFQIGNPYPSTINLATLYTDNYNSSSNAISPSFYELIPAGNYVSYNAFNGHISDVRASQYIVSGQGFLAQTTLAGQTITFKEDQKVAYNSSNPFLESINGPALADAHITNSISSAKSKSRTDAFISPPVSDPGNNTGLHVQMAMDSANYAQTGIYYSSNASDKYLPSEDAVEIDGGTPLVYLSSYSSDSVKLSINAMGDYGYGKRVRLYANAVNSGTYTMSLADISNIDTANYGVYLIDNKMQDSLDIVHYKTYTFTLNTADTTTFGSNRFVLVVEHRPVAQYTLATFTGQKVTSGVQLKWTAVNAGTYTGYTLQKLNSTGGYDSLYSVQSDTTITAYGYIDTHPTMGSNVYRLKQNGFTGAITYSATVTVGYSSTTPNGALTLYPNPAQSILNVNLTSNTINASYVADIYNSLGVKVNHQAVTGASWTDDVSSYQLGVYVMQIKDANGNIIGQAKFVKVN